jgi:hypothetical protein
LRTNMNSVWRTVEGDGVVAKAVEEKEKSARRKASISKGKFSTQPAD